MPFARSTSQIKALIKTPDPHQDSRSRSPIKIPHQGPRFHTNVPDAKSRSQIKIPHQDRRSKTTDRRSQTTDHRSQTTDEKNHRSNTTDQPHRPTLQKNRQQGYTQTTTRTRRRISRPPPWVDFPVVDISTVRTMPVPRKRPTLETFHRELSEDTPYLMVFGPSWLSSNRACKTARRCVCACVCHMYRTPPYTGSVLFLPQVHDVFFKLPWVLSSVCYLFVFFFPS